MHDLRAAEVVRDAAVIGAYLTFARLPIFCDLPNEQGQYCPCLHIFGDGNVS